MSEPAPSPPAAEAPTSSEGFLRKLSLFDATMLVVGTMIGSGIFATTADIARDTGGSGWVLAVWALAGIMTMLGALCYAELSSMMPFAGGQYVFLREAFSPLWGFLYGWTCFLIIQCGSIAAVAVVFARYLGVLVPSLGTDPDVNAIYQIQNVNLSLSLPWMTEPFFVLKDFVVTTGQLVAVGVIIFLTLLNCRGVQEGKIVQNFFTVAKTLALIGLIVIGLVLAFSPKAVEWNTADPWGGIMDTPQFNMVRRQVGEIGILAAMMVFGGAMVGALFSADAWNNVTFTAGEIKDPKRNLPRSLFLGAGIVVVLYVLANVAYMAALPVSGSPSLDNHVRALAGRADSSEVTARRLSAEGKEAEAEKERARAARILEERKQRLNEANTFDRGIAYAVEDRVGTAVVEMWSPSLAAPAMAIAIMISTFGCVNGLILMGARLYCVMARDGLFFGPAGRLNSRSVPAVGLIFQGLWSIVLVFSGTYNELLDFVIFAVLVFYVLTVIGLFVLRVRRPKAERPYRAFGYPFLPALYVLLCAAIMVNLLFVKPKFTWPGLIIVVAGVPVYFLWRMFSSRTPAHVLPPTPPAVTG